MATTENARCIPVGFTLLALNGGPAGAQMVGLKLLPALGRLRLETETAMLVLLRASKPLSEDERQLCERQGLQYFTNGQRVRLVGQDDYGDALYSCFRPKKEEL